MWFLSLLVVANSIRNFSPDCFSVQNAQIFRVYLVKWDVGAKNSADRDFGEGWCGPGKPPSTFRSALPTEI